jgi:single-stranded DNA-binding protein
VNHCLLEVEVLEAPQVRYTQDNQTPVAEMAVRFDGLRPDDPPGQLRVVGWGNLAQELQNRVQVGQRLLLEGRLRMSTLTRQDGLREKRAEFTLARLHPLAGGGPAGAEAPPSSAAAPGRPAPDSTATRPPRPAATRESAPPVWNTSPLVPEEPLDGEDEIPF